MRLYKSFIIVLFTFLTFLNAEEEIEKENKRVVVSQIGEDIYKIRIYLNFENPYQSKKLMVAKESQLATTLPIADRFELLNLKQYVKYKTSLNMNPKASFISMIANKEFVKQYKLVDVLGSTETIESDIPLSIIKDGYNSICINILQEATKESQGGGDSSVSSPSTEKVIKNCLMVGDYSSGGEGAGSTPTTWTQINTEESYIEFEFKLKLFKEQISSIYKYMFDNKNMIKDKVNFVFKKIPTEDDFNNYGFMANIIGNILKFKDIDFSVSTKIIDNVNNVIISDRKNLDSIFANFNEENKTLQKKLSGNINLIQNPNVKTKGILVITGDSQQKIFSSLIRLTKKDIADKKEQNIKVANIEIPEKVKPFTAPNFIELGEKILFSEFNKIGSGSQYLPYKTQTYTGIGTNNIFLDFKIYPTVFREGVDEIKFNIHYITANSSKLEPVFNIFLNQSFIHQMLGKENLNNSGNELFFESLKSSSTSALLKSGDNQLKIELTTYPRGDKVCGINTIQTTLKDDSYIIFPKGEVEVEYPNLKHISNLAFPFSIYPDLQNSGILVTDFNANTIASAMQIAFQLGKKLDYPAYHLITTYDINKIIDRDIIVVGNQIEQYSILYKNAPIKLIDGGVIKEMDIKKDEKIETISQKEYQDMSDYIIAQTYQSPFNPKRIVFDISATEPRTLLKGVQNGLTPQNIGDFSGDVWLYNIATKKSKSFMFKKSYKVKNIVDGYSEDFSKPIYKDIKEF